MSETEWVLDVEDDAANTDKLNEFRTNNIELSRKLAETEARQRKLEEALAKIPSVTTPEAAKPSTIEDKVTHLTTLFEQSKKETAAAQAAARQEAWRSSFLTATSKHKVRDDSAANALLALAQSTFKEKDGAFVPLDGKGSVIYSRDSTEPLSVDAWVEQQKGGAYRDLFSQPQGGGGRGSGVVGGNGQPRITMTREQAQRPTVDQLKAMQAGLVDVTD